MANTKNGRVGFRPEMCGGVGGVGRAPFHQTIARYGWTFSTGAKFSFCCCETKMPFFYFSSTFEYESVVAKVYHFAASCLWKKHSCFQVENAFGFNIFLVRIVLSASHLSRTKIMCDTVWRRKHGTATLRRTHETRSFCTFPSHACPRYGQ